MFDGYCDWPHDTKDGVAKLDCTRTLNLSESGTESVDLRESI